MIKIDSTAKVTVNLEGVVIKKPEEPDPSVPDKKQYLYPSNE